MAISCSSMSAQSRTIGAACADYNMRRLLIGNALPGAGEEYSPIMERPFSFRIWLFALLLVVLGVGLIYRFHGQPIISAIAEALIVAGALALVVDPLIKSELLREASRGIFIHLLGFEHHPQVKDKLKDIVFETKLLRARFDIRCWIET